MRFVRWTITWVIGSFLFAVIVGSLVWFVASVFGKELDYFPYIRNWFIIVLAIDFVLDAIKWNSSNVQWGTDMWRFRQ